MLWGKTNTPYYQLAMGYGSDSNFSGIGHESRGFQGKEINWLF